MARKVDKANFYAILVPDGVGGIDFVVINVEPQVNDPDGSSPYDRAVIPPSELFDFSQVTAGTPYDKDGIKGRLVSDSTTIGQIKNAVVNEIKSQAGIQ